MRHERQRTISVLQSTPGTREVDTACWVGMVETTAAEGGPHRTVLMCSFPQWGSRLLLCPTWVTPIDSALTLIVDVLIPSPPLPAAIGPGSKLIRHGRDRSTAFPTYAGTDGLSKCFEAYIRKITKVRTLKGVINERWFLTQTFSVVDIFLSIKRLISHVTVQIISRLF